ncbi:MAG: DUF883 family protein [Legionellaceae bacterium]|nr:DUF883 family protein [Legionellaceae bacterium]
MATLSKTKDNNKANVSAAASDLLQEGKKKAHELYEDVTHKVSDAEDSVKEYSDELVKKVRENPVASVLIAGGIGFLISSLLKK